jgi:hypothetical protein
MQAEIKTVLLVAASVLGVFLVPAVLIIFHAYLNAFFAIVLVLACFCLFGYYSYQELLPEIRHAQLEEEEIMSRFAGDPGKIRFYQAFKKHFDGDLNLDQLKQWLIDHPRKL